MRNVTADNTSAAAMVVAAYCDCVTRKSFLLVDNAVLNLVAWPLVTVTVTVFPPLAVGNVLTITELFVVTGASNPRLVRAVAGEIEDRIREVCGRSPGRTEGHREQSWVLLDYGDVIVHVFLDETREFYEIERLYKDVPRIDWRA